MKIPEKKLGFGFMRLPLLNKDDLTSFDVPKVEEMVDLFFKAGFTYWDTGWMYHNFTAEDMMGKAVTARHPRDSFTIATKMPSASLKKASEVPEIYEAQKRKLRTDYFDYYLVHNMNNVYYKKDKEFGVFELVKAKREAGEIKCLGFSIHDTPEFLDEVLTENPYFEFVQLQINYLDWDSPGIRAHECYDVCVKHGKKVVVMEPVKGGTLANPPENVKKQLAAVHPDWSPAQWAIKFAASLPNVMMVLSGMSTPEQVIDNTSFMKDFKPLTKEETDLLLKVADEIRQSIAIPCTGCRYCMETNKCPKHIPIPNYIALYNSVKMAGKKHWYSEINLYMNGVARGAAKASDCIACGGCMRACPQGINIISWMKEIAKTLSQQPSK